MAARFALAALAVLAAVPAHAGGLSGHADGTAQAQVVAPLTMTRQADLDFGSIFATTAAGTVAVSPDGSADYAGGAQSACLGGACAGPHPARFAVHGEPGRGYVIAVPATVVATGTMTDSGAAAPPLTVSALAARSASRPDAGPAGLLDAQGADSFDIGGTLMVPAGLPAARYRATIAVIVTYG